MEQMETYIKLVGFLEKLLSFGSKIILFDTTKEDWPILASSHQKGGNIELIKKKAKENYEIQRNKEKGYSIGTIEHISFEDYYKISALYIENEEHELIGVLAISMRCNELIYVQTVLSGLLNVDDTMEESQDHNPKIEPSLKGISDYIKGFGIENQISTYDERFEIICDLYDMGMFDIKGAVARTAQELGISDKSIYRYIANIKKFRG